MEFDRLRQELRAVLEGKGLKADPILKGLRSLKDVEEKMAGLEGMAMELQKKVIGLQQERDHLQERLLHGAPLSMASEVERRQNMELKEEITRLTEAQNKSCLENFQLRDQLEQSRVACVSLECRLKELTEPPWQEGLCSGEENKTDLQKAGEENQVARLQLSHKWTQTDEAEAVTKGEKETCKGCRQKAQAEKQALTLKIEILQQELNDLRMENKELAERTCKKGNDSSSDEDDSCIQSIEHKPKQKVKTLERQLKILFSENNRLVDKLQEYSPGSQHDPDEVIERIVELEDFCTELQDRVHDAEGHERQLREKLRVAEHTINELESSEAQYRDRCDELSHLEKETKKQLYSLQTTSRELREIILDKEMVEQALRDKVEFLEKVEAQSSKRITELEIMEKSLREQLASRESPTGGDHNSYTLQEKLEVAEEEIQSLRECNNKLEENEEILRENWRRVADEDANRILCLEEKVRMLDQINQDLKGKLAEAQDFVVINSGPAIGSLADELSASAKQSKAYPMSEGSDGDPADETLNKKVTKLKRQLSILEEEKNGKIANLQGRLAEMRENEIKLSETLAEMEMTERELRAKLALYESSEVTVEKMLKYQDKIHELRTSQESLLDQLETMESQEVTLQERLEETERRLKGKIVTLEMEMKNQKQKELKGNARIRELEKHEEELTEKTKKQEEKENGLYVRISSLMDQVKEFKTKVSELEKKLAEKDERCRKVASLETKFLQIEGAYREKVITLESTIAEAQSLLLEEKGRHEEARTTLEEQITSLQESVRSKEKEHTHRVFILEEMFAQKEKSWSEQISSLEDSLAERDRYIAKLDKEISEKADLISELETHLEEKDSKVSDLETALGRRQAEGQDLNVKNSYISELEMNLSEKDFKISTLEQRLTDKDSNIDWLNEDLRNKNAHLGKLEKTLGEKQVHICDLERDLEEKQSYINELETDLGAMKSKLSEKEQSSQNLSQLKANLCERDSHIQGLEEALNQKMLYINQLKEDNNQNVSHISHLEIELHGKTSQINKLECNLDAEQKSSSDKVSSLEHELAIARSQFSELSSNSSESSKQLANIHLELEEKRAEVRLLKNSQQALEKERDQLQAEALDFETQLKDRDTEFQVQMSIRESHFQQACASLDAECESLRAELTEKNLSIEKLESNKNELLSKVENLKDIEKDLTRELSALETECHKIRVEREEAKQTLSSFEDELKDSYHEKEVAVENLTSLEKELHSCNNLIQIQADEISRLEADLQRAKAEAQAMEGKLFALHQQEVQNTSQADALVQQEVLLKSRISQVEARLEASTKSVREQEDSLSDLLQQKQNLKAALTRAETDISDCHKLNEQLQKNVSELKSHTNTLQDEVTDLTKQLTKSQSQERALQDLLDREKNRMCELESQIGSLKEEKQLAFAKEEQLHAELIQSLEEIKNLKKQIQVLEQNEESLKSQISVEQGAKIELDRRLSKVSEEAKINKEKANHLEKLAAEQDEEIKSMKSDLLTQSQQLKSQGRAIANREQKNKELDILQQREKDQHDRACALEDQIRKHQVDQSHLCQKLQVLEKREKELLEQITDIEQSVIVPLETENSELKEEVISLKEQNTSLNLQIDKQEENIREDLIELKDLRKRVNDLQLAHSEAQSELDILTLELKKKESENEMFLGKLLDSEAQSKSLHDHLERNRIEMGKIEQELSREMCNRDTQTEWDIEAMEAEHSALQSKVIVLQDAEDKFMSRIVDLEEHEQQLVEELQSVRSLVQDKYLCDKHSQTDEDTESEIIQELGNPKVSELHARVQELEAVNQKLTSLLEKTTANEVNQKQFTEKIRLLEQSEDHLMERVMELEENEVTLRAQIERSSHRAKIADELEEEVTVLLHQEDEWKEKVGALTSEKSTLSQKVESLHKQLADEQSKNEKLSSQVKLVQKQLHDNQKDLRLIQTSLQAVRSEYEEKLSALEESEKKMENQLGNHSQQESDLRQEIQVLREEMEDVCDRYKELEQENSALKQQHTKVLLDLKDAESRCLQLASETSPEPPVQAMKTHISMLSVGASGFIPQASISDQKRTQIRSDVSVQARLSPQEVAWNLQPLSVHEESLLARISELEKELSSAKHSGTQAAGVFQFAQGSNPTDVHSTSSQSVKILTMHEVLRENSALKAQLQSLLQQLSPQSVINVQENVQKVSQEKLSSESLRLQREVSQLQARVAELEKGLAQAEGAVQEVVTVVRTRSVHTLEQKIETIQHIIHTQSHALPLHQELLELLTMQADLLKQVSHLMETEHNLRSALKEAEDELSRMKSVSGAGSVTTRRTDADRRYSMQLRLSQFGGRVIPAKLSGNTEKTVDSDNKDKHQWLERQVADLKLSKSSLERRLHEAERRLAFRPRSTTSSRDELLFQIEQLQEERGEWRKKVEDLEALNSHYLKEKLELAQEKNALEEKFQEQNPGQGKEVNIVFVGGTREEPLGSSGSVSEGECSSEPSSTMLDRPEDLLQKRIKELESQENYLRQQLSDVESDREQLHEITRKDKATIHEQNVRLRELILLEKNLRAQISGLEDSERSHYNRCSEQEDKLARLEDRVHELEVHERRLRELVRKLKLDEEVWLSKSDDLTTSVEKLSSSEISLRKIVQDLQVEKGGLTERAEYLETRVKELEKLETTLSQKLKNCEKKDANLQSRIQQLEYSETAAKSKASELSAVNIDLSCRLQRAVEENAVLSQHVAQQQGQIHELDRKLSAASDAEVGLSQHVESLQKSEGSLHKKVREYELRDIDAQAHVRELEQTVEILKDKINQLQRSENRLKSRLAELESTSSQTLKSQTAAQKQQLPQKLEDCQKQVVALQQQLQVAQAKLHQTQLVKDDATTMKVPTAAWTQMQVKVALLEETEFQINELEKCNAQLSEKVLLLQRGKGSCGHEVELEILKRRLHSYQNSLQKLKHHLSEGQVPSLWAADTGQGPESEDLPARDLQGLESERVLHSVRSLTKPHRLPHAHEEVVQPHSSRILQARRAKVVPVPSEPEESHWRTVELRHHPQQGVEPRGASTSKPRASVTTTTVPHQEELIIGLSLASESERSSFKSQNDTDSEMSGPAYSHQQMVGTTKHGTATSSGVMPSSGDGGRKNSHPQPMPIAKVTWPPASPSALQQRTNSGFVTGDSFHLPSPVQSQSESQDDEAPPLPVSAPPGVPVSGSPTNRQTVAVTTTPIASKTFITSVTLPRVGRSSASSEDLEGNDVAENKQLQTTTSVGLSIRQRIAQIERQLTEKPSQKAGAKEQDEELFTWKSKAAESARLLGAAERESKHLKDDLPPAARRREKINKLEKDLEEKRRYIDIFEKWIPDAEEVLKNKNKKNDRDIVQQLQTEVKHLKQDLKNAGYRKDDISTDPAALKTELDRKDRELIVKHFELDSLVEEMQNLRLEYDHMETVRTKALDALKLLEDEVAELQDAEFQLKQIKEEYSTLQEQFEDMWKRYRDLHQSVRDKDELEYTLKRTILERDHLQNDLVKVTKERDELESKFPALHTKVRDLSNVEAENTSLEAQVASLSRCLKERTEKVHGLCEENASLQEQLTELQFQLGKLQETKQDLDNMCAQYDEVMVEKNKAIAAVHSLHAKVARLAKKCQEKDELLLRLGQDLQGQRGHSGIFMKELTRLEALAPGEEYNRPLTPLDLNAGTVSEFERLLSERIPHPSITRWSSFSSLGDPHNQSPLGRTQSSEQVGRGQQAGPVSRQSLGKGCAYYGAGGDTFYVALLDYQPETFSQSGHRTLELSLKEGDHVRVRGPVDRHGYCEAEVDGRTGLVPVSYLYPVSESTVSCGQHQTSGQKKLSGHDCVEQIVQMFDSLQDPGIMSGITVNHSTQVFQPGTNSAATQTRQQLSHAKSPPEAPSNVHIEKVEENSLVLAWKPPVLDQSGCSNGSRVVGYRIYLNGRVCQQPHNPKLCQTRVAGIRHDRPQQLAIQTLAVSGQVSSRVELLYQGRASSVDSSRQDEEESDTDLSSILNSIQYKTGKKCTVMGLYDYDPKTQSPGDYTAFELAFQAGDILQVYGEQRPDGFFYGERNGQQGLVPAYFVKPIPQNVKSSTQKKSSAPSSTSPGS